MFENAIQTLEKLTGCSITVIDNDRVFARRRLQPLFTPLRRSHRKNAVCACGFDERCIEFCRYRMNSRCMELKDSTPFVKHCWKGLSEIVVPLNDGNVHYGMFYGGIWRSAEHDAPPGLPDEFYALRAALPLLPSESEGELKGLLQLFGDGVMFALRKSNLLEIAPDSRGVKVVDFLREHAAEGIGLPDLARALELSESRTSLLVKELFGRSFSELLQLERVGRVKQYLAGTGLRLHEIADLCGFSDEFHLSKVFKRHIGVSPRDWRTRKRRDMVI